MNRLDIVRVAVLLGCGVLVACAEPPPPPAAQTAPAPAADQIYVVVERGQSLDTIAKTYRVTKRDIIAANNLTPPYAVKPGMVLAIPAAAVRTPPPKATAAPKPAPAAAKPPPPERAAAAAPPPERQARVRRPPPEVIPLD